MRARVVGVVRVRDAARRRFVLGPSCWLRGVVYLSERVDVCVICGGPLEFFGPGSSGEEVWVCTRCGTEHRMPEPV